MPRRYSYNYITIDIPSDCETDPSRREDLAILQAKDRLRTWRVPARWYTVWDNGEQIRLCRATQKLSGKGAISYGH